MEPMVTVLYNGALAQYSYSAKDQGVYILWLQKCRGYKEQAPPGMLVLHREGRRWYSEGNPKALVDDLGYAIEEQIRS